MKYNHLMDLGFTVIHEEEDPANIPSGVLIAALLRRVAELLELNVEYPGELNEALGCCDTIPEEG